MLRVIFCFSTLVIFSAVSEAQPPSPKPLRGAKIKTKITAAPLVKPPTDLSLAKEIPVYAGVKADPTFKASHSPDNRHFLVASYFVVAPFESVVAFYKPHMNPLQPMVLTKHGNIKLTQGWFKAYKREKFAFRVHLLSPVVEPSTGKPNPKLTRIQYYLETR